MDQETLNAELPDSPPEQSRLPDAAENVSFAPELSEAPKSPAAKSEHSAGESPEGSPADSIQISKTQIMRMMAEINMLKRNQLRKEAENLKEAHKEKEVGE